jgi:histidine triad (HIT) family protein
MVACINGSYLLGETMIVEGTYDRDNPFAKILRNEASAAKVYEDADVLAFMDLFPQSEGHVLVIPKTGIARNILDVEAAVLIKLVQGVQRVTKAVHKALRPDGVIVTQFNGQAAGQTVYHLHFHVIPCWAGQPLKGHAHGVMAAADHLHLLARKIAACLED